MRQKSQVLGSFTFFLTLIIKIMGVAYLLVACRCSLYMDVYNRLNSLPIELFLLSYFVEYQMY